VFKSGLFCAVLAASAAGIGTTYGQAFSRSAAAPASSLATSPFASFAVINAAAVDGSMLSLRVFEGGLSRVIIAPDGAPKKTNFTLLNDRLGTVAEGEGNVVGLFVLNQATISTAYADGRSEVLSSDAAGSFSITAKEAKGGIVCASWYPAGHHFSANEREAALARYANRLGLDMPRSGPATRLNSASCVSEIKKIPPASALLSADEKPQPSIKVNSNPRSEVLRGIMARVFALYTRKQPAVPPYGGLAATGRPDNSQSWEAFDRFYSNFVAGHEGGYTENDGNGAPANYGINQGANPDVDVLALTQAQAEQILYERYWLASGADQLPAALAAVHGDTAINLGLRAADELLAQSGGDPNTYLDLRDERYRSIAAANPDKTDYLSVWLRRSEDLRGLVNNRTDLFTDRPSYAERPSQRRISTLATSDPDY
jgi:hypothetical protein